MTILLIFFLLGLFLQGIKMLLRQVMSSLYDFRGDTFLARSRDSDYVNSFSTVSAKITNKAKASVLSLPKEIQKDFGDPITFELGINDPLGKQSFTQTSIKLTA